MKLQFLFRQVQFHRSVKCNYVVLETGTIIPTHAYSKLLKKIG